MRLKKIRYMDLIEEDNDIFVVLQDRSDKQLYKIKDPKLSSEEEDLVSKNIESIFTIQHNEESVVENSDSKEDTDINTDKISTDT